jgi:molybdopterin synthase catalytic subunit
MIKIKIQNDDFSLIDEHDFLTKNSPATGAVVNFIGRVREFSEQENVTGLVLEHYPGMTEKSLAKIIDTAKTRWSLERISVVHRIGKLSLEDNIVYVGVSSAHRESAFEACRFIMDYLKTEAPFWKKEITPDGEIWVEAREKDHRAREHWNTASQKKP